MGGHKNGRYAAADLTIFCEQALRCKNLWLSALECLIKDCCGQASIQGKETNIKCLQTSARAFIASENREPATFWWMCEVLDIDYEWLKTELLCNRGARWHLSIAQLQTKHGAPSWLRMKCAAA